MTVHLDLAQLLPRIFPEALLIPVPHGASFLLLRESGRKVQVKGMATLPTGDLCYESKEDSLTCEERLAQNLRAVSTNMHNCAKFSGNPSLGVPSLILGYTPSQDEATPPLVYMTVNTIPDYNNLPDPYVKACQVVTLPLQDL